MKKICGATRSLLSTLLFAEGVSTTITLIADIALPVVAITRLGASPLEVGLLSAANTGAPLIFGLSAGVLVSKFHLKHVFTIAGIIRVIALLSISILGFFVGLDIYELCIAGFLLSCAKLITDTAMATTVPSAVPKEHLEFANSRLEMVNSFAQAVGPAMCGAFLRLLALENIFLLSSASSVLSSLTIYRAVQKLKSVNDEENRTHVQDILYGVKILWNNNLQRAIAIAAGLFNLFHAAFFTVFTIFAFRSLSFHESSFGLLLSLIGLVGVAGAYFASKIANRIGAKYALIGTLIIVGPLGIPIIFLEYVQPVAQFVVIAICLGAWDFVIVVHLIIETTIRQLTVPVNQLSRVAATTRFISWGADPIGAALGGVLTNRFLSYKGALLCCLLGMSLSGLFLIASRSVRNVDNNMVRLEFEKV